MNFNLSLSGKISAALIMAFVLTGQASAAGIVAGGDAAKQAQINTANNGAVVVNIVAPGAAGLSHNQFKDFNVGLPGAVLNNSTIAGQSQLAGQLNANTQLGNQAAKVILNEVVSRNPSLLLGKQEIFGMAADYVLANPNGITCDGCGFINTPRASLLVGTARIENGSIQSLNAAQNRNLLLVNTGGAQGEKVLDLIAPRIEIRGSVRAEQAINAIAGFNNVALDQATGTTTLLSTRPAAEGSSSLDSYYLGAIQAGRVNLVSTAAGAGVNITGPVTGQESVQIESAAQLNLTAAQLKGRQVGLQAGDISSSGKISTENKQDQNHDESWFIWQTGAKDTSSNSSKSTIERSSISGDQIHIQATNKATLTATDIDAKNVLLTAAQVDLSGQKLSSTENSSRHEWKNSWASNEDHEKTTEQQAGTRITAEQDIQISATAGDLNLQGSTVQAAKDLALAASGNIGLSGLIEKNSQSDSGNRKNDGASLQTGSWSNSSSSEQLVQTKLKSGQGLDIRAGGNIASRGAVIQAGADSHIAAKGTLDIATQTIANSNQTQNQQTYWGGIGGGGEKNNDQQQSLNIRSEINSNGRINLSAELGININGSTVKATEGAFAQASAGGIIIDSARDLTKTSIDQRNGTVFNITKDSDQTKSSTEKTQSSTLKSDADLTIISAKDIAVSGSQLSAGDQLSLKAGDDIQISSSTSEDSSKGTTTELKAFGYAKESGDQQYRAGVRIEHTSTTSESEKTSNAASGLSGGHISIAAGGDTAIKGSALDSKGNTEISGKKVAITAAADTASSNADKTVTGGGFYYTGGIDKAGSGYEVGQTHTKNENSQSAAVTSSVKTAGDLTINAGQLSNEGSQLTAGGKLALNAEQIDNKAAANTSHSETQSSNWSVDIGANVDYSKVTRPIEKAVTAITKGKLAEAQAAGGIGAPNAGIDLQVKAGNSQGSSDKSQAVVSQITGKDISIASKGAVQDQATQYKGDTVRIQAGSHDLSATANTQSASTTTVQGQADLRVYTETGKDVNLAGSGKGGQQTTTSSSSDAVTGGIAAKQGIVVQVQDQARYQGSQISSGEGKTIISAGGDVRFDQANNSQSATSHSVDGKASLSIGMKSGAKDAGAGAGAQVNSSNSSASTAVVGTISGKGAEIQSGKDLTFQGTQISSGGDIQLQANKADFQAATSQSSKTGSALGGNLNAGGGSTKSAEKSSGSANFGVDFNLAKTDESTHKQAGGSIQSAGKVEIRAEGSSNDAISMAGTQIKAESVALDAAQGGVKIESAQSGHTSNNWNVAAGVASKVSQSFNTDSQGKPDAGKDSYGINTQLKVGVDKQDLLQQQNARIEAKHAAINTGGDAVLNGGNIVANSVSGKVGGDLLISSRQDRDHTVKVDLALGLNAEKHQSEKGLIAENTGKLGMFGGDKATAAAKDAVNKVADKAEARYESFAFKNGLKTDTTQAVKFDATTGTVTLPSPATSGPSEGSKIDGLARKAGNGIKDTLLGNSKESSSITPTLDLAVQHTVTDKVNIVSGISGKQGVALGVGGKSVLTGATVESAAGTVAIGKTETQTLAGQEYSVSLGLNASTSVAAGISKAIEKVSAGTTPVLQVKAINEKQILDGAVISAK